MYKNAIERARSEINVSAYLRPVAIIAIAAPLGYFGAYWLGLTPKQELVARSLIAVVTVIAAVILVYRGEFLYRLWRVRPKMENEHKERMKQNEQDWLKKGKSRKFNQPPRQNGST